MLDSTSLVQGINFKKLGRFINNNTLENQLKWSSFLELTLSAELVKLNPKSYAIKHVMSKILNIFRVFNKLSEFSSKRFRVNYVNTKFCKFGASLFNCLFYVRPSDFSVYLRSGSMSLGVSIMMFAFFICAMSYI